MAFARFGWDKSDVYLYGGVLDGPCYLHVIVCAMCLLDATDDDRDIYDRESLDFETKDRLLAHLDEHKAAGHTVPQAALDRIRDDDWIPASGLPGDDSDRRA